jgi:hypothetical protein
MAIHVANVMQVRVKKDGTVANASATPLTIKEQAESTLEWRVVPDASIPNSAGWPKVKAYLEAEATATFKFVHMDQTFLITQN